MGAGDNHTSLTVIGNLAASLENRNKDVNTRLYWDAVHGADEDPEHFIAWIGKITGFKGTAGTQRPSVDQSRRGSLSSGCLGQLSPSHE